MTIVELEAILEEYLEGNFRITHDKKGQVIIQTGMMEDNDGELIDLYDADDDVDEDELEIEDGFEIDEEN